MNPFDKLVYVIANKSERWITYLLEDEIVQSASLLCQIGHQLVEFSVEVTYKLNSKVLSLSTVKRE